MVRWWSLGMWANQRGGRRRKGMRKWKGLGLAVGSGWGLLAAAFPQDPRSIPLSVAVAPVLIMVIITLSLQVWYCCWSCLCDDVLGCSVYVNVLVIWSCLCISFPRFLFLVVCLSWGLRILSWAPNAGLFPYFVCYLVESYHAM